MLSIDTLRFILTSGSPVAYRLPADVYRCIIPYLGDDEVIYVLRFVCRDLNMMTQGFKLKCRTRKFCTSAELMKWAVDRGCPLNAVTFMYAAERGDFATMKWLRSQGCLWDAFAFEVVNNLEIMKWLKEEGCPTDNYWVLINAAYQGNLEVMKWLREQGCPWNENVFGNAASNGNLENMKWLKEQGCPMDTAWIFELAAENGNIENMRWFKEQGCPWKEDIIHTNNNPIVSEWIKVNLLNQVQN
jgi:hypothetical protein